MRLACTLAALPCKKKLRQPPASLLQAQGWASDMNCC
jgi:hypothetical protein